MTRINLVPPRELCDQHLLAEYRELPRIPRKVADGWQVPSGDIPCFYVLGTGHVKFFYNKIGFLLDRHDALCREMQRRGFEAMRLKGLDIPPRLYGCYVPTLAEVDLNKSRIAQRISEFKRPSRWTCTQKPQWVLDFSTEKT